MLNPQSTYEFNKARQRAFLEEWLSFFTGRSSDLLSFEDVRQKLRLQDSAYRGLQEIELDKIIGSTGRYRDFTRTFLPKNDTTADRWQRVDAVAHDQGFPPIEVFQVGGFYFVRDGNHRVSVARMHDAKTIEAYVVEYKTPISVDNLDNLDNILLQMERAEFLEDTALDTIRPDHNLLFTEPGRYRLVREHIGFHKYLKETEAGREISNEEAVASWHDNVYRPLIELIREERVLRHFPGRTEADLYAWLILHRAELEGEANTLGYISDEELLDELISYNNLSSALTRLLNLFTPKLDLQNLSLKAARARFLEETQLDKIRPEHDVRFTEPSCYLVAQEHIRDHKYLKETEAGAEISYAEAVSSWYDHVYQPVINLIGKRGVLKYYANHTEADLYIWFVSRRATLEQERHSLGQVSDEAIIEDLAQQTVSSPITRLVNYLRHKLDPQQVMAD